MKDPPPDIEIPEDEEKKEEEELKQPEKTSSPKVTKQSKESKEEEENPAALTNKQIREREKRRDSTTLSPELMARIQQKTSNQPEGPKPPSS
mmetsp:Transcript_3489/g.5230  ORF Transcript_3489/g.5230 Transcript_3489/m.5230 type:complete len:92 (+) Transcript_3489:706-981(+)